LWVGLGDGEKASWRCLVVEERTSVEGDPQFAGDLPKYEVLG
jgi:hypothetical protein